MRWLPIFHWALWVIRMVTLANKRAAGEAGIAPRLQIEHHRPGEHDRWTGTRRAQN
jgi:hypothetical protein